MPVQLICQQCQRVFKVRSSRSDQKFCGWECKCAHQRTEEWHLYRHGRSRERGFYPGRWLEYRNRHRDRYEARLIAIRAIRRGALQRGPCLVCGEAKTEAHHEDYSKPLDVLWLCRRHHLDLHIQKRRSEKKQPIRDVAGSIREEIA